MRSAACLFRDGIGLGPVVAVQDCFGPQYHAFRRTQTVGTIVDLKIHEAARKWKMTEGEKYIHPVMIIARVHVNTIRAVLRRSGRNGLAIVPGGLWYEVHGE